jgi:hypothetical protein
MFDLSKQFTRPQLQNNQRKIDQKCGSSSRAPALQLQKPEFKHQAHQKKKKKKESHYR